MRREVPTENVLLLAHVGALAKWIETQGDNLVLGGSIERLVRDFMYVYSMGGFLLDPWVARALQMKPHKEM